MNLNDLKDLAYSAACQEVLDKLAPLGIEGIVLVDSDGGTFGFGSETFSPDAAKAMQTIKDATTNEERFSTDTYREISDHVRHEPGCPNGPQDASFTGAVPVTRRGLVR